MKATKLQVELRVNELVRILLAGAKPIDVREYVTERSQDETSCWHVPEDGKQLSDKQLFNYTRRAGEVIAASTKEKRRKRIERHLAQRQYLYAQACAAADYRTALAVLKDECELRGD